MPVIKAIETRYKGYRFRSRLEARWAVFFDAAGVKWEYETQGFMLPSGPYLPDFLLPDLGLWFEVKGKDADEDELQKCRELRYGPQNVILSEGNIGDERLTLFTFFTDHGGGGEGEFRCMLSTERSTNQVILGLANCGGVEQLWDSHWNPVKFRHFWAGGPRDSALSHCYQAARSARFEHGEGR